MPERLRPPSGPAAAAGKRPAPMLRTTLAGLRLHLPHYGTAALVVVLGVMLVSGTMVFTDTLQDSREQAAVEAASSVDAVAVPQPLQDEDGTWRETVPFTGEQLERVRALPEVAEADGLRQSPTLLQGQDGRAHSSSPTAAMTIGEVSRFNTSADDLPDTEDQIALGSSISEQAGHGIGDTVTLLGPEREEHEFTVTALLELGAGSHHPGAMIVTPDAFRAVTGEEGFHEFDVLAAGDTHEKAVAAAVRATLGEGSYVRTGAEFGEQQTGPAGSDAGVLRTALLSFALLAVAVCAIVVHNTFALALARRRREFALLRCLGAEREQVLRSVLTESFTVGLVASGIGVLAGVGLGTAAAGLSGPLFGEEITAPVVITPTAVLTGLLAGTVMTVASSLAPAARAVRVAPSDASPTGARPSGADQGTGWVRLVSGATAFCVSAGLLVPASNSAPGALALLSVVAAAPIALAGLLLSAPWLVRAVAAPLRVLLGPVGGEARLAAGTVIALTVGATLITGSCVVLSSFRSTPGLGSEHFAEPLLHGITALVGLAVLIAVLSASGPSPSSVPARARQTALLLALGLSRSQLYFMLGMEAAVLCLTGAATGLVLGTVFGLSFAATALPDAVLEWPAGQIAGLVLVAFLTALAACLLSARRAARTGVVGSRSEA